MKLNKRVKIGNKWVGDGYPCFIIAEVGANHDRRLSQAKKLIDIAGGAGADAVKFQIYSAETLYSQELKALPGEKEKPFNIIKRIEMPRKWIPELANYSKKQGLIFFSTPFDKEAIGELNPFVPAFKWASPELIDRFLLEYIAKKKKPLIISTGFYGLKEVLEALKWVRQVGNNKIIILHCTGVYPTFPEEVNLKVIPFLKKRLQIPIGLSDHTLGIVIPAAAVALGANIIEKHFTLSRRLKGPDHPFALEPKELKEMVKNIRNVEKSLGLGIKKPTGREIEKEKLIRRGIVAARELKKGEKITPDNVTTKRVGQGAILPKYFFNIQGKKLFLNMKKDSKITWRAIK